jgi:hypothetical protein
LDDVHALETVVEVFRDSLVRRAYLPKLRELREKYELLLASGRGDDLAVLDASIRLYGRPREDMFQYALRHVPECVRRVQDSSYGSHPDVRAKLDVVATLGEYSTDVTYPWDSIVFEPPRPYAKEVSLSAEQIRVLFCDAFAKQGISDWRALVDAPGERTTFNVNHTLRTVFIPSDADISMRKYPLTQERVEALIAHEVATHVVRRVRGEESPLALLGVGLAGYLRGEEGIATYVEQRVDGTRHFAGEFGYLSVGWACGLDGTPRTFRGLYEVLHAYMTISALEHALEYEEMVEVEELIERTRRRAWARCVRIFRGTSGTTPGACFTKDIVYLEGNVAIWQLMQRDPTWEHYFRLGKYDPTSAEHVSILCELGMISAQDIQPHLFGHSPQSNVGEVAN